MQAARVGLPCSSQHLVARRERGALPPQAPPARGVVTSLVDAPRAATIHEYLDWTVTAEEASTDEELVQPGLWGQCRPAMLPFFGAAQTG